MYKCGWCGGKYEVKEALLKRNDISICFSCILGMASTVVNYMNAHLRTSEDGDVLTFGDFEKPALKPQFYKEDKKKEEE